MNRLHASYHQRINLLPLCRKLGFACACAERVLPLFEKLRASNVPRAALDRLWECVRGEAFSPQEITELDERVSSVVPVFEDAEAYALEKDIAMKSAVMVLEALDVASGSVAAALNAGSLVFDILMIVERFRNREQVFDYQVFDVLERGDTAPEIIEEEWEALSNLVDALAKAPTPEWNVIRGNCRARGDRDASLF